MEDKLNKLGIILFSIVLYFVMFMCFTKFIGALTLILGIGGTFYLYFINKKFKMKKIYVKVFSGIAIFFMLLFFGIGGIAYNPDLATTNKIEPTEIVNGNKDDKENVEIEEPKEIVDVDEEVKTEPIINNTDAEIHFINTGNSDAIVIKQGEKSVLIDAGDNDDETLIVNYLKGLGITKLTYVISTHPDADHCGGLDAVFNTFDVEKLLVGNGSSDSKTYSDFINAVANKGISPSVPLEASEHKISNSSYIKIYNVRGVSGDSNESSLVTLFINGNDKILFMGDAGEKTESKLINNFSDIDLLKIGHHGSKTSTSEAFLNKLNAKNAVILVGKDNKYGHPSSNVMSRLESKAIEVHRTDECGNIVYKSTGDGVTTDCTSKGSYLAGENKDESATSSGSNSQSSSSSSNGSVTTNEPAPTEKIVYWTPSGKSYHYNKNCRTLSRSKTILEGTGSQCPKTDPCNVCAQ